MKLKDTKLVAPDPNGGAIVALKTNHPTLGLSVHAPTQTDRNQGVFRMTNPAPIEFQVAVHAARLDKVARSTMRGNPGNYAAWSNRQILTTAKSHNEHALTIMTGIAPAKLPWDPKLDRYITFAAASSSRTDVLGLPAYPKESIDAALRRIKMMEDLQKSLPDASHKTIVPVIPANHPKFLQCMERIIDEGLLLAIIQFHGMERVTGTLAALHELIINENSPPFLVGTNVPRYVSEFAGSGSLLAARFGIQASAPRVHYGKPDEPEDEEEAVDKMRWFYRNGGGYPRRGGLPPDFREGCPCPDCKSHLEPHTLPEALGARRRHEAYGHAAEKNLLASAISAGTFKQEYRPMRPMLDKTLAYLSSK